MTCGGDLIALFAFATGLYYNVDNIIQGWKGAKDKTQALKCLFPYL